ncbi:hypothetical protein EBB07_31345 [Paenibacillaceae bacterium]|nr:hypothetical protein EBB07_31345 [Paenibacillaceae bacterium]
MVTRLRTKNDAVLVMVVLSILYALFGEVIYYFAYTNDAVAEKFNILTCLLIILYTLPVVLLFRNKYWALYLLVIVLSPFFSILFLLLFGGFTPVKEDDMGVGFLYILVWIIQEFCMIVSALLGLIINFFIARLKKKHVAR